MLLLTAVFYRPEIEISDGILVTNVVEYSFSAKWRYSISYLLLAITYSLTYSNKPWQSCLSITKFPHFANNLMVSMTNRQRQT